MKPAICTQCGANIEVDETRDAGICTHCGTPFVTEKVINNFVTQNVHNVTENVTKIIYGNEKDEGEDFFRRGLTFLKLNNDTEAAKAFGKATELSPERAEYWFYYGVVRTNNFTELNLHEIKNFFPLATAEEKERLGNEYGVNLGSINELWLSIVVNWAKGDDHSWGSLGFGFNFDECKEGFDCREFAEKYLSTVRGLDEKLKTPFFTQTKPIYEIVRKYFTADEKKEAEKIEYAAANMVANGNYIINAPRQFTDENGVFKIPEGNYERISLDSIDGVQTLVVSPTVNWISCERHSIPVIKVEDAQRFDAQRLSDFVGYAKELVVLDGSIGEIKKKDFYIVEEQSLAYLKVVIYCPKAGFLPMYTYNYRDGLGYHRTVTPGYVCGNKVVYPVSTKIDVLKAFNENLRTHFGNEIKEGKLKGYKEDDKLSAGGCYIATCVYGSYDCPEVWVLRRYRDFTLKSSALGRLFIKVYYAVSPRVVKLFGKQKWFNRLFKRMLDKKVKGLKKKGFEETKYYD